MLLPACVLHLCCFQCVIVELVKPEQSRREPLMSGERQVYVCVCVLVTQSCLNLCNPIGCRPPGSSVHGILQARILEWVAIPFFKGPSRPRDQTWVFCIASIFLTI